MAKKKVNELYQTKGQRLEDLIPVNPHMTEKELLDRLYQMVEAKEIYPYTIADVVRWRRLPRNHKVEPIPDPSPLSLTFTM